MKSFSTFLTENTTYNLVAKYKEFNKKFFNNKLPIVPVTWMKSSSSRVGGLSYGDTKGLKKIEINPGNFSEKELDTILVHEMVHGLIYEKGLKPKRIHGKEFSDIAKQIKQIDKYMDVMGTTLIVGEDVTGLDVVPYYFIIYTRGETPTLKNIIGMQVIKDNYNKAIDNVIDKPPISNLDKSKSTFKLGDYHATVYEINMNTPLFVEDNYKKIINQFIDFNNQKWMDYQFRLIKKDKDNTKKVYSKKI